MNRKGKYENEMWDEEDGFFYDLLRFPDGRAIRMKVRSMVGLLSLCANSIFPGNTLQQLPNFAARAKWLAWTGREC